jgi:hypothetical protein
MSLTFKPPRQSGFILHFGALLLNLSIVGFFVLQALSQQQGVFFILFLVASVITFIPIPLISYRLFALLRSRYTVDREGIGIQWGLREEVIPMSDIEWVRSPNDLTFKLPIPPLSVQGAVLGSRIHPDLGYIEYVASDVSKLILIASRDRIYAISPKDVRGFMNAFSQSEELGSIAPIPGKSISSNFLISALLQDKVSRTLLLLGIIFSFGLLILTSFVIPLHETIPLGFNPIGASADISPSDRLLLLPLLSFLMMVLDISLGAYLYRKEGFRIASYITFAACLIMPLSFFGLIIFLIL